MQDTSAGQDIEGGVRERGVATGSLGQLAIIVKKVLFCIGPVPASWALVPQVRAKARVYGTSEPARLH